MPQLQLQQSPAREPVNPPQPLVAAASLVGDFLAMTVRPPQMNLQPPPPPHSQSQQPRLVGRVCSAGDFSEASVIQPPQLQQPLLTPQPHVEVASLVGVFLVGVTLKQQPQQLHQQRQQQLQLRPQLQLPNAVASSAEVSWAVKKQDQSFVSIIRFH